MGVGSDAAAGAGGVGEDHASPAGFLDEQPLHHTRVHDVACAEHDFSADLATVERVWVAHSPANLDQILFKISNLFSLIQIEEDERVLTLLLGTRWTSLRRRHRSAGKTSSPAKISVRGSLPEKLIVENLRFLERRKLEIYVFKLTGLDPLVVTEREVGGEVAVDGASSNGQHPRRDVLDGAREGAVVAGGGDDDDAAVGRMERADG